MDAIERTVDVAVDGAVVIEGFAPGDMQDLSSFAGQTLTNLEVRPTGTEDVAIGPVASFAVPASGSWTVVAHLDAEGTPTITPFENDTSAAADGQGRLTVRHTAAAPAVDIVLGDARPVENLSNPNEASRDLPAGQIAGAQIAPTGGEVLWGGKRLDRELARRQAMVFQKPVLLRRSAAAINRTASRFTPIPIMATTTTRAPSTSGGSIRRRMPS